METIEGVVLVDLETEQLLGPGTHLPDRERTNIELPRVVAAARAGSTVVAVIERRPPLAVSHDGGSTWRETGGGLPAGFAVAVDESNPDRILYAARNRLYLSEDGGTFWRRLEPELADILDVALL
ncbi:MAG TPA: sialidase family protein [Gaiellaceae bacterium]